MRIYERSSLHESARGRPDRDPVTDEQDWSAPGGASSIEPAYSMKPIIRGVFRKRKIDLNHGVRDHSHGFCYFEDSAVPSLMGLLLRRRAPA